MYGFMFPSLTNRQNALILSHMSPPGWGGTQQFAILLS